MITWKRPPNRGWRAAAVLAASVLVPAALFALPVVPGPSLARIAELLPRPAAPQEAAVLWITAGGEYRIGAADAPVMREERLAEALSVLRREAGERGTLIVRSDSSGIDAPGMGYAAVLAGNAACEAGFSRIGYELVKRAEDTGQLRIVASRARPLAPPCAGTRGTDTTRAHATPTSPEADGADAVLRMAVARSGRPDTIPDDTVHQMGALERQPSLVNATEIQALMNQTYPADLIDAGIGGRVLVEFQIGRDGVVDSASVGVIETSHERLGEATRQVVTQFRFRPAIYQGRPVRTLVRMPVTWQPPAPAAVAPRGAAPAQVPVRVRGDNVAAPAPRAPARVPGSEAPAAAPAPTRIPGSSSPAAAPRAPVRVRGYEAMAPGAAPAVAPQAPARVRVQDVPAVRRSPETVGFQYQPAAASPVPADAPRRAGQITGTVTNAFTNSAVSGASVTVGDIGALTNEAGRFTLRGVPAGTHELRAVRVGYSAATQTVTVAEALSTTANVVLSPKAVELEGVVRVGPGSAQAPAAAAGAREPAPGTISGRVLDAAGRPVAGATVASPGLGRGAVSNEEGRFVLRVPAGDVEVHVLAPGAPRPVIRLVTVPRGTQPVSLEVTVPER